MRDDSFVPVEKFIEKNRLPHLLFYGPPGTGKTSTILAVARRIYGVNYKKQILEASEAFEIINLCKINIFVAECLR